MSRRIKREMGIKSDYWSICWPEKVFVPFDSVKQFVGNVTGSSSKNVSLPPMMSNLYSMRLPIYQLSYLAYIVLMEYHRKFSLLVDICREGYHYMAGFLIYNGADVRMPNDIYETPLYTAAEYGHKDVVILLLAHLSITDIEVGPLEHNNSSLVDYLSTPLSVATENNHRDIIALLKAKGATTYYNFNMDFLSSYKKE